ncbi:hypothetical protein QK061_002825 [Escherichia coli]|uniref:Uncharacterized protein n=5 Tax=Enterobacteriaceae TaxID=543 RepID=A0A0L6XSN4_ECOLX|nr:hypothetical protein [Escherichia coli]EAC0560735.1 hypothetical protein [Salmonella enterica subsp. enterica serovar Schwarzengrund]EAN0968455.1 hypothetical protein [Salmonella enterica subsp. enterica serovar 4,[5],12:i:-]EAN2784101.1 hypothetical protein [Salmonella enterica]EBF4524216.1 hypothetical protein [Salmonella enterica subsp. enterica serovar Infantis]EBS1032448.1 hypothetical protein [Salmonella enterica subsp. enterica serovar Java]EBS5698302.1 hypothetical protein [Salmone
MRNRKSTPAGLQLGFSPLSKTIMLARMRDIEGGRLRVGNDRGRDFTNEAAQQLSQYRRVSTIISRQIWH